MASACECLLLVCLSADVCGVTSFWVCETVCVFGCIYVGLPVSMCAFYLLTYSDHKYHRYEIIILSGKKAKLFFNNSSKNPSVQELLCGVFFRNGRPSLLQQLVSPLTSANFLSLC